MLGMDRVYLALPLALVTAAAVGCGGPSNEGTGGSGGKGSSSSSSSSTGGGEGGAGGDGGAGGEGAGLECPSGEGTVLAVSQLFFGEGTSGEWKKVGYNLDGLD